MNILKLLIKRIIALPFVLCIALIGSLYVFIDFIINYLLYGGELIVYKKGDKVMIRDIFDELKNKNKNN